MASSPTLNKRSEPVHLGLYIAASLTVSLVSVALLFSLMGAGLSYDGAVLVLQPVSCAFYGWIGTKVAYRWRDMLMLLIPFVSVYYAVKVLWRAVSLPYAYWRPVVTVHGAAREATFAEAIQLGMPRRVAALSAMAAHPINDAWLPSAPFEHALQAKVQDFTAAMHHVESVKDVDNLSIATLESYRDLAIQHEEHYYAHRFKDVLEKNQPFLSKADAERFGEVRSSDQNGFDASIPG